MPQPERQQPRFVAAKRIAAENELARVGYVLGQVDSVLTETLEWMKEAVAGALENEIPADAIEKYAKARLGYTTASLLNEIIRDAVVRRDRKRTDAKAREETP